MRFWLCALVGLIALLAAPTAVGAQTNILNNGGFEEPYGNGAAGGWFKWHEELNGEGDCSNETILHKPQWSAEIAGGNGGELLLEGQRSQHVGNQFATWHGGVAQTVSVTPGNTYTFSVYSWGRASQNQYPAASDTGVNLNVRIGIDPTGGGIWSSSNIVWSGSINPHQSWQQVTVQATATSDTMTVFAGSNTGGANNCRTHIDIWFDNASLVASGPPPTNTPPPVPATNTPRPTNTRPAVTNTPWPTRTPWPTHTPTPIPPTLTATPTLTAVPTATPTPTSTLTPTPVTPSPTPLPTGPWFTKTPTPWPTSTTAPVVVNTVAPAVVSVSTPVAVVAASTTVSQPTEAPTDEPEPTEDSEAETAEAATEVATDAATEEVAATEAPPTVAPTSAPQEPQGGTICINTFSDENSNGLRDTTEGYMAGISVVIGQDGAIIGQGSTTGTDDAVCFSELEPSAYEVAQRLPSSLQMTTASNLEIAVENGQTIGLEFGSRLADLAPPTEAELANAQGTDGMVSAETDPTSAPATNPPAAVESPSNGLNTTTLVGIGIMALAVVLLGGILVTLLRKG